MSALPTNSRDHDDRILYSQVGYSLLGGLLLSIGVMVLGLLLTVITGSGDTSHVLPLDQILGHLRDGSAGAVLDLGILLLFATPLVGVLVALQGFIRQGDTSFASVTAVLLVLLGAAFAIALR